MGTWHSINNKTHGDVPSSSWHDIMNHNIIIIICDQSLPIKDSPGHLDEPLLEVVALAVEKRVSSCKTQDNSAGMSSDMIIWGGRDKWILCVTTLVTPMEGALQPGFGHLQPWQCASISNDCFMPSLYTVTSHDTRIYQYYQTSRSDPLICLVDSKSTQVHMILKSMGCPCDVYQHEDLQLFRKAFPSNGSS